LNNELDIADVAFDIVENTRRNMFLTGEAGTGKTTFLKRVLRESDKKCIVVAPTGVAAINAGGSTIHSMFGLPTRMFLPTTSVVDPNVSQNIPMLQSHFHYPKPKLDLFKNFDLLIIDEISMVRADLFDAIDTSLRFSRRSNLPFGGVQVLLIGDLFQLPPVVKQDEKMLLDSYYDSEYFFSSRAYQALNVMQMQLNKVYRQSNRTFISLLNNVRNAQLNEGDYEILQERYQPHFEPDEEGFVTLCSHNSTADHINKDKLAKLAGVSFKFAAEIKGDFFESQYPAEPILELKEGAQVMFIKNDISGEKRYYNGKIAVVSSISNDKIEVVIPNSREIIEVEKDIWQNLKYNYDEVEDRVMQNEVGSFKHFPLKLAWAITIHKSQGLTLEKVIIDAERSFAPGQVYVALSRCVTLEGLYLKSGINGRNILIDPRIVEYSQNHISTDQLPEILEQEKRQFGQDKLLKIYEFDPIRVFVYNWKHRLLAKFGLELPQDINDWSEKTISVLFDIQKVAEKFQYQINQTFAECKSNSDLLPTLTERCSKATVYFVNQLDERSAKELKMMLDAYTLKNKQKKWRKEIEAVSNVLFAKRQQMIQVSYRSIRLFEGEIPLELPAGNTVTVQINNKDSEGQKIVTSPKEKTAKAKVGEIKIPENILLTKQVYEQLKSIEKTALERDLSRSTVETHLVKCVELKQLKATDFMHELTLNEICAEISNAGDKLSEIKAKLNDKFDYFEIKIARATFI
jgi:ATP-dependent DNA helicase PIF1